MNGINKTDKCGLLPHTPSETMNPGRMRIRTDGKKEAAKHSFDRKGTGTDFRAGMPIGNGDFGASMHGCPDNLTFNIAKNDLWWDDYENPELCLPEYGIEGVRQRLAEGKGTEVKLDLYEAANRRRNHPCQTEAARLTLHLLSGAVICDLKEHLDYVDGYAEQKFSCDDTNGVIVGRDFSVCANVSRADDVMRIACTAPAPVSRWGMVRFELTRDLMEVCNNIGVLSDGEVRRREREIDEYYSPVCFLDGKTFGFTMRLKAGESPETSPDVHYTVMATVVEDGFRLVNAGNSILGTGRADKYFTLLLTVVSTHDAEDTCAEAKRRLSSALARNPYHVFANGSESFNYFWKRSWIRLPEKKWEIPWYWGLYEAYSARREGKFAPAYVAPWYASCYGNWGFHILTYEQDKSNLGLLATNHAELLECWFGLCVKAKEKLEKFTQTFYGMRGTCYPHAISGTGEVVSSSVTLNGTEMNIETAGESVRYAWEYYLFTGDLDFLREVGYPILKGAALFYGDYLQTAEDGHKYIFPSRSQEFVGPPGYTVEFMTDSLIDRAMFRYVLTHTAEAAELLGADPDLAAEWKADAAALHKGYAAWPDGTWKTCEDCTDRTFNYGTPSVSDLAPIVLTDEADPLLGDDELREAAVRSVKAYAPDDRLPWDLSFGILARLRFGDRKYARLMLDLLPKSREGGNLNRSDACNFDENNEMSPDCQQTFFVDKGTACFSELITEMLLQSQGGILRLFPAYPTEAGDAAFFSLRAKGAFLVSAEVRDGAFAYAIVRSLRGNLCRVLNPLGDGLVIRDLETGETVSYSEDERGVVSFATVPDHEYALEAADRPLESFPILA